MNKKDRRIRLFLELFFLAAGIYIIGFKVYNLYIGMNPDNFFHFHDETIPIFDLLAKFIAGLASIIASWSLWVRAPWSPGWCLFTLGLLLYGNILSMGHAIYLHPARAIPMVVIVLVALQSFPFLIRQSQR